MDGLLGNLEGFVAALRRAGVPVGVSEVLDATWAVGAVDILDRRQLRAGLAATLVKRPAYRDSFDPLFDLWWPPALGEPEPPGPGWTAVESPAGDAAPPDAPAEPDVAAVRAELRELLLG